MRTTVRLLAAGLLAGVLAAASGGCGEDAPPPAGAPGDAATPGPGDAATPGPGDAATTGPGDAATPEPVRPTPGMTGVRAVRWEEHAVSPDGTTVQVRWWSGVEPCTVLDRVEVGEDATSVTITLFEGSDPAEPDAVCPMIAVYKSVEVTLEDPVGDREVRDGAG